jgi:hypothetical protein
MTVAGQKVLVVDLIGTFRDQASPLEQAVEREDYRMLAAIIQLKEGNYFVKFVGPRRTVTEQADNFRGLIESLELK